MQELVRLHGGEIRVESDEGRGTTFLISVPFGTAHLPKDSIAEEHSLWVSATRASPYVEEALRWLPDGDAPEGVIDKTAPPAVADEDGHPRGFVLLADDNADMRDYISRLLAGRHEVQAVADGEAALEAIRVRRPDLILTDVMMPKLDGFGLLRAIREDSEVSDLPVIVLSARAGEEASVEGLSAGADDYIVKPFSARELIARVDSALAMANIRRQLGDALRESEARFRNMADNAPVMIWTSDTSGRCTFMSRYWCELTGQTAEEALGFGWVDVIHPEDRQPSLERIRGSSACGEAFSLETRARRQEGSYRWILSTAVPEFDDAGAFTGYIGSTIDVTERKQAEEAQRRLNEILEQRIAEAIAEREAAEIQLRHAQKMEAVGKLTGGVAHDFNNLLQVIGGNLQLLTKYVGGNEPAERRLQNALAGVSRGAKLAAQLLAFGRRQPLAPNVVNLGRFIRGLDDLLRRALGDGVEIETVIAGGLWNTLVDRSQVENALLNLAINARDAMSGHGRLTIEAGNSFLDDTYAAQHSVNPGQYVMLAVTDTGCGIPAEMLEQVFEPFFTTKPEGQGTGLGLSMVYGFVKQSGGHIKIYSETGQGTTIRIYLPRIRQAEDITTETEAGPVQGGTETVLVVEDDDDVRDTVVEMMAELGYRVLKARDAQSALAIVDSGVTIDLLFTDVVMPGPLRSPELARKARERQPRLAVLFTSGYTDDALVHGGRLDEGIELLTKPYTREALARKVRQVMGHEQQTDVVPLLAGSEPIDTSPAPGKRRAGLHIMLVEDDSLIRMITVEMLIGLGHSVVEAANGTDALAMLAEQPVDVLLTDLGLPGIPGDELAVAARRHKPDLRIIFASGHDAVPAAKQNPALTDAVFLRKPYDEGNLAEALKSVGALT